MLLFVAACGSPRTPERAATAAAHPPAAWFTDATVATGLQMTHFNGMTGEFLYPEVMAPGVALFDYDNDGDLDVFVPQGRMLTNTPIEKAIAKPEQPLRGRLFRNDVTGRGGSSDPPDIHFTDVTEASGINQTSYGMGVATGDFNNDGCVDLYVTALGSNQLFRNNCNGTFTDVTASARVADPGWSVPAAFVDVDRDGWLDLFVGHYLRYTVAGNVRCYSVTGLTDYCPPNVYRAEPSHLFHNNRNGTFTDITAKAGMSAEYGAALGLATADFNGDGWIDIHVSNDSTPNQLWINQHDGTFTNAALLAGTAVGPSGEAKASMGADAGDFDNDGDEDLVIGELLGQGADLYVNDGTGTFTDDSAHAGVRVPSLPFTTFGAGWIDVDNDGWLDILAVNGAVTHTVEALARKERFALQQKKLLLHNTGGGRFEDATARAGAALTVAEVSRGLAFGDLDNDGDVDAVVGNDAGPVQVLLNSASTNPAPHWIGLRLLDSHGRDALGARVTLKRADGKTVMRRARADGSYASANDPRVVIGLGSSAAAGEAQIVWPDGEMETRPIAVDRYTTITQEKK
ncbi:MAG TPA: CRTAC1 family protein [Vicinamibacterales bacterium]|nr:CRTAC1 family protein [Vicinamibacterales bacterium]